MKKVSFKVAKALKEAGYPQRFISSFGWYNKDEKLFDSNIDVPMNEEDNECVAPTYLEVWLWLWREKGFRFELAHPEYKGEYDFNKLYCNNTNGRGITDDYSDPEEAIIAAIDDLVDNKLIK